MAQTMARLIDADEFFKNYPELDIEPYNNAPTVEVDNLILIVAKRHGKREMMLNALRPHGKWSNVSPYTVHCSVCNKNSPDMSTYIKMKFCPNCGADMRTIEKDNNVI